jgi:hypothetical protein
LQIQRQIAEYSTILLSNFNARAPILTNIQKAQAEYENRKTVYLSGKSTELTIDDVMNASSDLNQAYYDLASNIHNLCESEDKLMAAVGEVYRLVGLRLAENGDLEEPPN